MRTDCAVCTQTLVLTIVYVDEDRNPVMWKMVEPWYQRADNELPSKLHCPNCELLYDHES